MLFTITILACSISISTTTPPSTSAPATTPSQATAAPIGPAAVPTTSNSNPTGSSLPSASSGNSTAISASNYHSLAQLHQWNVESDTVNMYGIALSPHADKVALITLRSPELYSVELHSTQDGTLIWKEDLGDKAAYPAIAFSPNGSLIAVGLDNGNIIIYNSSDGSMVQTFTGNQYSVRKVAFSPDGTLIASGSSDNTARVWQVSNGMSLGVHESVTDVRDISFSPDSKALAMTTNYINVYDATSDSNDHTVFYDTTGDTRNMGQVAFTPDGSYLIGEGNWFNTATQQWRFRMFVWDFPFNTSTPIEVPLTDNVEDLAISPDERLALCDYADKGQLLVISIGKHEIVGTVDLGPKLYMAYSQDMSTFAIISSKTTVNIWGVPQ